MRVSKFIVTLIIFKSVVKKFIFWVEYPILPVSTYFPVLK